MEESRDQFSTAADSTAGTKSQTPKEGTTLRSTRSRPASAGTRLRQKPANAAAEQDFFASLGIDNTSRTSTTNISNRSSSFSILRPGSAAGPTLPILSSPGWTPPPFGGLGSKRSTPLSVPSNVGSTIISSVETSFTTLPMTKLSDEMVDSDSGATTVSAALPVTSGVKSSTTTVRSNPTQLFSMEDAEELYSDDGWNCESPSTILSYSMEATAKSTTAAPTVAATPKSSADEYAWGDDDEDASPVAASAATHMRSPLLENPIASFKGEPATETKMETSSTSQSLPSRSALFCSSDRELKSLDGAQMASQNIELVHPPPLPDEASPLELRRLESDSPIVTNLFDEETISDTELSPIQSASTVCLGATSSFLSTESAHDAAERNCVTADKVLTDVASPGANFTDQRQNVERKNQSERPVGNELYAVETLESSTNTVMSVSTTKSTIAQSDTFVAPPVELASPGGAAGEFWGNDDEAELFDSDEHADVEWNVSIKSHQRTMVIAENCKESSDSAYCGQETSFSLSSQPSPLHVAAESFMKQEPVPEDTMVASILALPDHQEELRVTSLENPKATISQETAAAPVESSMELQQPAQHEAMNDLEVKTSALLVNESRTFSSVISESENLDNLTKDSSEPPRTARFLHTSTGTGGAFGHLPSLHDDDISNLKDDRVGSLSSTHDAHQSSHTSATFPYGEKCEDFEPFTDSSGKCDSVPLPCGDVGQYSSLEQVDLRNVKPHQNFRQGRSDDEERDSVVSFSGEHSFFPPAGRPTSLNGGSQSSFTSHRMYPSSLASTDHDGSSIASFGVSSAGATFGGSERVSDGGAISDGTMSETPSMVGSSNASTAFGTDFVSVSEGQYSAPGTTIGGSDNASDGAFSDGNASETASLYDTVNTRSPFVSEYSATSEHYITEAVVHHGQQEHYSSTAPDSRRVSSLQESSAVVASPFFESTDTSDKTPLASSANLFSSSQNSIRALSAATTADTTFARESGCFPQGETTQSASLLFGATAGADVPNPFSSSNASFPSMSVETRSADAHELPTSDAGDLFGAGPPVSSSDIAFAQPVTHSLSSSFQAHGQTFSQVEHKDSSRQMVRESTSSHFEIYNPQHHGSNLFAPHVCDQYDAKNLISKAGSTGELFDGHLGMDQSISQFGINSQTSANTVSGGYLLSGNHALMTASHFKELEDHDQYEQRIATSIPDQGSMRRSRSSTKNVHPQIADSTFGGDHRQIQNFDAGALRHHIRQSSTSSVCSSARRDSSGNRQQQCDSDQRPSPAKQSGYEDMQSDQRFSSEVTGNYSHQSAADVSESVQESHDNAHLCLNQNPSRGASTHFLSSSVSSASAFFGQSLESSSDMNMITAPTNDYQQPLVRTDAQHLFERDERRTLYNGEQHNVNVSATVMRPGVETHNFNQMVHWKTPASLADSSSDKPSVSRNASASSLSRFQTVVSHEHQFHAQQPKENISARHLVDASSSFGRATTATGAITASSFFGGAHLQDTSEVEMVQHTKANNLSTSRVQATLDCAFSPQQKQEHQQEHLAAEEGHQNFSVEYGRATSTLHVSSASVVEPTTLNHMDQRRREFSSTAVQNTRSQACDTFASSGSDNFREQHFSDLFHPNLASQAHDVSSSHQHEKMVYCHNHEQELIPANVSPAEPMQLVNSYSANPRADDTGSYGESSVHVPASHPEKHRNVNVHGADVSSFADQMQGQASVHEYSHQQQLSLDHPATDFKYHRGLKQTQTSVDHRSSDLYEYGSSCNRGHELMSEQYVSRSNPAHVMMTSYKYKDPCVAPPSCLASFGFGGNLVTMFPKRKVRLNIAGSSFRNSPRGASKSSDFENGGNGELRKGPVNLYRMDQLHPKDKNFMQMDSFPGPLTENITEKCILDYIDDRLNNGDADESAFEDENDRLLLGVLRILVKCNGRIRSKPGTLKTNDPDSPESQLIKILYESCQRRSGDKGLALAAPRNAQFALHPNQKLKNANQLRELLLIGDRKGAVSAAMGAQMWPEAMLIASFTDKEEYRQVLRAFIDETYAVGDPSRALFMSFADQQEKSVQEPRRLLHTDVQQHTETSILSAWSLATGVQVEAPVTTSKIALLGGDHRTPTEARFYVSPGAVQRTEIYEWAHKYSKGASANLMIPFQGYKLIYAMLLADHGKLETAFRYVTSMLAVINTFTATSQPGTSMYLEGMKNQLTVLDDRLRQHLGQDRVASVAASTNRSGASKQGKWGFGSALSIMGKIVNRVVEGSDSTSVALASSSSNPSGGLYANEVTPAAASYPSTSSVTGMTLSPMPLHMQQHAQQSIQDHSNPPLSQGSAPGSSRGYNRNVNASPAKLNVRSDAGEILPSGPLSGNGHPGLVQQQLPSPYLGKGRPGSAGQLSNNDIGPLIRSNHSMEPPGSNRSTHSNSSLSGMTEAATSVPRYHAPSTPQHRVFLSQTSQYSQHIETPRSAVPKPAPLDLSGGVKSSSEPKTVSANLAAELTASLPALDASTVSGPASDKGRASPRLKKSARSKTPPPSGSSKGSGWLSGLSSFIVTKMNPEAKVAKLGEQMEAYFDEDKKRWVFPGESAEDSTMPSAPPPIGPVSSSAPGSNAAGVPPIGTNSAPGSVSSGPAPSDDPLAALMAPPPSYRLMRKDPLAAMMAPPSRPGLYAHGSIPQRKPPRPQFAVFKPNSTSMPASEE
ncbi:Regucalcin gene promoter region-related protein (RGPR) [Plasmopara halstedii]|uniref:Protein transport protein sec16 n=1 Tax=Plasmopara halstedii TaxID=4781 RepID=A0A0P1B2P1_PLAHL|nr:Regucalcin gene promoter region-related protein (RGPR) [Plasmopara halstedii]CEG48280.1 Regucalcin gene promoter region-related protein (RGPR) [Plasmopara halstedii]|eukprot:XP_024584649.1 Regucalcin gene promoter region-related protein (RGPR) [Plasmopara halstedii]